MIDVMRIVHIADTPARSLVTHILSTSLAAGSRGARAAGGRNAEPERGRVSVSEQGPAVNSTKRFTNFFDLADVRLFV